MSESFDVTTLVFALLALFVLFKLRSVLGTRTGAERPPHDPFARQRPDDGAANSGPNETANVIRIPGTTSNTAGPSYKDTERAKWEKVAAERAWVGLDEISAADLSFDVRSFVEGSKVAYEMIVSAFAAGDKRTLQDLLAKDVFDGFVSAIASRESRGEKVETSFVSIEKSYIDDVHLRNHQAQITVRFVSKLITVVRDRSDSVIDGSPEKVVDVIDVWTFSRDLKSRDPNWRLIATETAS